MQTIAIKRKIETKQGNRRFKAREKL